MARTRGGPSRPGDLVTRATPPGGLGVRSSRKPAPAAQPEAADEGCTCGAEIGEKLERIEAGEVPEGVVIIPGPGRGR